MIYTVENWTDKDGNPAGGVASGTGFCISWQNGPLGRGKDRKEPNGAFVEDIIKVVIERLEFYQESQFACEQNQKALGPLHAALTCLNNRTQDREQRGVEGLHKI